MHKISLENIKWGEWGTYSIDKFMKDFSSSPEFMNNSFGGYYDYKTAINNFIFGNKIENDSLTSGLFFALYGFATRLVPHRLEDINGNSVVYNPQRDNREGARPSIPEKAPDIFKWILEGDWDKGHAIISEFDQETRLEYDDHYTTEILSRKIIDYEAHAVSVINKFPAYVRIIDDKLINLLEKIGFLSDSKSKEGKQSYLRTIPFGLNFVSFPYDYSDSLSTTNIFNLYSIMKAIQNSLKRESETQNYDVFFNIGYLAGGTIPRIHMQAYLRTKKHSIETYSYQSNGNIVLSDVHDSDTVKLDSYNRSWQTFSPQVKTGKFDIKIELKNQKRKSFRHLDDIELWDLSELLVYNSRILDSLIGISERNIQFFPTGIVIRPFAVDGGHEKTRTEMIQGQPSYQFSKKFNRVRAEILREETYKMPNDKRGK